MITAACFLLAAGLFVFVFAPAAHMAPSRDKSRLEHLRERKAALLENLRDLNFEFRSGKFSEAEYRTMRSSMEDEAAALLLEIEQEERRD